VTVSPSAGWERAPGPRDQAPLSVLGPGPRDQAPLSVLGPGRGPDADRALWARLVRQARCADSSLDADQWFPVSNNAESAVGEAADAIAVCRSCRVRSLCLALSLRHWDVGQYGVWGGLVAADRARLRRRLLAPGPEGGAGPAPQHDDGPVRAAPGLVAELPAVRDDLHRENGDVSHGSWRVPAAFTVLAAPDRAAFAAASTPPPVSQH
jgi:hypothetical protein